MPKIKKSRQKRNLRNRSTFIEDTSENSPFYFNVTQIDEEFNLGKNGMVINGSENLAPGADVEIEILDVRGNVIYHEIRPYVEGVSRVVGVFVYGDTPAGQAEITILSEAIRDLDGTPVPPEQREKLNVKWTGFVNVNPNNYNEDTIRFIREPDIIIGDETYEKKRPELASTFSAFERIGSPNYEPEGVVVREEFEDFSTFPLYIADGEEVPKVSIKYFPPQWAYDYLNAIATGFDWLPNMEGELLFISSQDRDEDGNEIGQQLPTEQDFVVEIEEVISNSLARVKPVRDPYIDFQQKFSVDTTEFFLVYERDPISYEIQETSYIKNLQLGQIQTLTGAVYRAKVYNRLRGENENFSYVGDFEVEPVELLTDIRDERTELIRPAGVFESQNDIDNFLIEGPNTNLEFEDDEFKDSVKVSSTSNQNECEFTIDFANPYVQTFEIFDYSEYTLEFQSQFIASQKVNSGIEVVVNGRAFENVEKIVSSKELKDESYNYTEFSDNFFPRTTASSRYSDSSGESLSITFRFTVEENVDWNWYIRDIRLQPAQEAGFSPDYTILKVPVDLVSYDEIQLTDLVYRVDLFDINGNKAGVFLQSD